MTQLARITWLVTVGICLIAALILYNSPAEASSPRADRCGSMIVGIAGCASMTLSRAELAALKAKALKGDRGATDTLMHFYGDLKGGESETRRWTVLAAERGSCWAIDSMHRQASEDRKPAEVRKWRQRARWNKCELY